jgi:hypothetical protein
MESLPQANKRRTILYLQGRGLEVSWAAFDARLASRAAIRNARVSLFNFAASSLVATASFNLSASLDSMPVRLLSARANCPRLLRWIASSDRLPDL